jgi:hypothetical protein
LRQPRAIGKNALHELFVLGCAHMHTFSEKQFVVPFGITEWICGWRFRLKANDVELTKRP